MPGVVAATHEYINATQLKEQAKSKGATITQYLTAVLIFSIYQEQLKSKYKERPIKISVPVNLKKYFPSKTISNFFKLLPSTLLSH